MHFCMQAVCNGSWGYFVLTAKHRTSFLHFLQPGFIQNILLNRTNTETYLHLYQKIKDAICKPEDFLKLCQCFPKPSQRDHDAIFMPVPLSNHLHCHYEICCQKGRQQIQYFFVCDSHVTNLLLSYEMWNVCHVIGMNAPVNTLQFCKDDYTRYE